MKEAFDFSAARTNGITEIVNGLSADKILVQLAQGLAQKDKRVLVSVSGHWGDFTGTLEFASFKEEINQRSGGVCKGITYNNGGLFFWLVKPTALTRFWHEPAGA